MVKPPKKKTDGARGKKRGLFDNINARKRARISRPKSQSTVSEKSYKAMKSGWGKKPKTKTPR